MSGAGGPYRELYFTAEGVEIDQNVNRSDEVRGGMNEIARRGQDRLIGAPRRHSTFRASSSHLVDAAAYIPRRRPRRCRR
jgi:hypothetical protein